jgi:hypothetical protein
MLLHDAREQAPALAGSSSCEKEESGSDRPVEQFLFSPPAGTFWRQGREPVSEPSRLPVRLRSRERSRVEHFRRETHLINEQVATA